MEKIYTKIYLSKTGLVVIEGYKKDVKGIFYRSGEKILGNGSKTFIIGNGVNGVEHIAASKEALEKFKKIISKAEHTDDDIGDFNAYKYKKDNVVCFSWIGHSKRFLNEKNAPDIVIGCGEGMPNFNLLDDCKIFDNKILQSKSIDQINAQIKVDNEEENINK